MPFPATICPAATDVPDAVPLAESAKEVTVAVAVLVPVPVRWEQTMFPPHTRVLVDARASVKRESAPVTTFAVPVPVAVHGMKFVRVAVPVHEPVFVTVPLTGCAAVA
jgi:hypothetical protein